MSLYSAISSRFANKFVAACRSGRLFFRMRTTGDRSVWFHRDVTTGERAEIRLESID